KIPAPKELPLPANWNILIAIVANLLFWGGCYSLTRSWLRRSDRVECVLAALTAGGGLLFGSMQVLACFHQMRPPAMLLLCGVVGVLGAMAAWNRRPSSASPSESNAAPMSWLRCSVVVMAIVLLCWVG